VKYFCKRLVYEQLFNSQSQFCFEFYDYSFHAAGEIFYVAGRERGEFGMGRTVLNMAIRTSRIFRVMNGRWLQVHHHGSIDDPDLLSKYPKSDHGECLTHSAAQQIAPANRPAADN
jgi:hypothetical protein